MTIGQPTPATNLRDQVAGASWSFLLPSLELGRVVCVGTVSAAELATLARIGREVLVVDPVATHDAVALANVRFAPDLSSLDLPDASVDLIRIAGSAAGEDAGGAASGAVPDPAGITWLARLLAPGGRIYLEEIRRSGAGSVRARDAYLEVGLGVAGEFVLHPWHGEPREALPIDDAGVLAYVERTRHVGVSRRA